MKHANPLLVLPENTTGRDFVVGDIHGHYDLLVEEMDKVSFDKDVDRLFAVGDLIDRGPKSFETLKLIREPWFYSVVGNHEDMMFQIVLRESYSNETMWYPNGGEWSKDVDKEELTALATEAYETLPLAIQFPKGKETIGIVHASPPYEWTEEAILADKSHVTWDRYFIRDAMNGRADLNLLDDVIDRLYMGHTPVKEAMTFGRFHWIDTGAFATKNLTLIEV